MNILRYFVLALVLLRGNSLLYADNIYFTLPKNNTFTQPTIPQMQENLTANIAHIETSDNSENARIRIINEELAKVKVPTEATDELLFLALQQEQEAKNAPNKKVNYVTTTVAHPVNTVTTAVNTYSIRPLNAVTTTVAPTSATIKNNSKFAIECALTALHTTSEKTPLFSRKYNKYITQTTVSSTEIIKSQNSGVLTLNTDGVTIANNETIIALAPAAIQITSKKHVKGEGTSIRNETLLETDLITDSWLSTKAVPLNTHPSLDFPGDFVHGLTQIQSQEGPNYYNLIGYMRACERMYEYSTQDVQFPPSYFDPNYLSHLDKKELDNVYSFIMKRFYQKSIPLPSGLSAIMNCGKYNFIAKALVQIALSIVMLLTGGGGIAALSTDAASTVQTIVDNSMAIGQGVQSLKAKGRG